MHLFNLFTNIDLVILSLSSDKLEDALVVAPQKESAVFRNRNQFDLVVMYDADSESFGPSNTPMSLAMRIIFENEFQRVLKRPPVILVGGIKAWKASYPTEIVRDEIGLAADLERTSLTSQHLRSVASQSKR